MCRSRASQSGDAIFLGDSPMTTVKYISWAYLLYSFIFPGIFAPISAACGDALGLVAATAHMTKNESFGVIVRQGHHVELLSISGRLCQSLPELRRYGTLITE